MPKKKQRLPYYFHSCYDSDRLYVTWEVRATVNANIVCVCRTIKMARRITKLLNSTSELPRCLVCKKTLKDSPVVFSSVHKVCMKCFEELVDSDIHGKLDY